MTTPDNYTVTTPEDHTVTTPEDHTVTTCAHEPYSGPPGSVRKCRLCRKSVRVPQASAKANLSAPKESCPGCTELTRRLRQAVERGNGLQERLRQYEPG
jgi:hypothetical protein